MMPRDKPISEEDAAIFRDAVGQIEQLSHDKVGPTPAPRHAIPEQTLKNRQEILDDSLHGHPWPTETETGDELLFVRPGVQHRLLKKLRRGQFSVGAELDLHGHRAVEARELLVAFLKDCRTRDVRCIRIVHGKGLRSPGGIPVLKEKMDRWLRLRDEVIAFCSTPPGDGGTGAVYVLLKRR
jgi:DNA-nicking Smr family endonuclease